METISYSWPVGNETPTIHTMLTEPIARIGYGEKQREFRIFFSALIEPDVVALNLSEEGVLWYGIFTTVTSACNTHKAALVIQNKEPQDVKRETLTAHAQRMVSYL